MSKNVLLINLKANGFSMKTAPQGIAKLGGLLKKYTDLNVSYLDEQIKPLPDAEELIKDENLCFIGISSQIGTKDSLFALLDSLSKLKLSVPVLVGNVLPTYSYKEILERYPHVICSIGRGEPSIVKLAQAITQNKLNEMKKNIPCIAYMENDKIILNDIENDTEYESPADFKGLYRDLPIEKYEEFWLECSHGCPRKFDKCGCRYCAILPNCKSRGFIERPLEYFFEDLDELVSHGISHIKFSDEEFLANSIKRIIKVAKYMKDVKERVFNERGQVLTIDFAARVNDVIRLNTYKQKHLLGEDSDFFKMLKEAGLIQIYLGIESGCDAQLLRMNKGVKKADNLEAVRILKENNIRIAGGWIMFDPLMEDMEELIENGRFLREADLVPNSVHDDFVTNTVNRMMVLKGAPLVEQMKEKGLLGKLKNNMTEYEFEYLSPWVKKIVETLEEWDKNAGSAKLYRIKSLVSLIGDGIDTGLGEEMEKQVSDTFFAIKRMNLEICEDLAKKAVELKKCGGNVDDLVISDEYIEKYNTILQGIPVNV